MAFLWSLNGERLGTGTHREGVIDVRTGTLNETGNTVLVYTIYFFEFFVTSKP